MQQPLPSFRRLQPMNRAEYEALPAAVRAFLSWEDASQADLVPDEPRRRLLMDEQEIERLLQYFESARHRPEE